MIRLVRREEVHHWRGLPNSMGLTVLIYKSCLRGTFGIKVKSLNSETDCLTWPLSSHLIWGK